MPWFGMSLVSISLTDNPPFSNKEQLAEQLAEQPADQPDEQPVDQPDE